MKSDTAVGSLALRPKHPGHVPGDSDDATTTRWHKAQAMGINLPAPRPHRAARGIMHGVWMGAVVWAVIVVVAWLFWRWVMR